ncbi:hypothetical protein ACFYNL_32350 [Streptomyces sp. NPDC007808]|uniref:hypothetical protein n=1 Tax=Streptomyces sp. NPDC007808 TaxID=3364779 RepID=UPI0036AEF8E8
MSPPSTGNGPPRSPTATFVQKAAYVVAPGTVVFALLYYFGSIYNKAYYSALGVIPEDLGFSVQGTVASSANAVFIPLCLLLAGGLVVYLLLGWLGLALAEPEHAARRRSVVGLLLAVGAAMVLVGFPALFTNVAALFPAGWPRRFIPALLVALGATLAVFAVHQRLSEGADDSVLRARAADRMWLAGGTLLVALLMLSLFYGMAQYVADLGRGNAILEAERGYPDSAFVVVHSRLPLSHHAERIGFTDHGGVGGTHRYEYRGFRLLAKTPSRFYLVSHATRHRDRLLVVLPDNGSAWLEIRSP